MPNSFDLGDRGPSNRRLFVSGVALLLIAAAATALMIAKYQGRLDPIVRVSADLSNVGDGLPAKSDVKFRGVLVGFVSAVVPTDSGRSNIVRIDLKPQYASGIPDTVTARVVPSNVFAVSSVQLVDNENRGSAPLRAGAVIPEDQTLPTVLFQTTVNKLREILTAIGREPSPNSIGWLTALGEATQGRGDRLEGAGRDLNEIVAQLNTVVAGDTGPSTISALTDAADGLREAAPELFDALGTAVKPMQTLAEKRSQLTDFLSAGLDSVGQMADSLDNQTDRLINITTQLTPVMGLFADNAYQIHNIASRINNAVTFFNHKAVIPESKGLMINVAISLTPFRSYVRADCPRYGEMLGPSCFTAPEVPVAPALGPSLGSRGLPMPPGVTENRPNFAPPRGSMTHAGEVPGGPAGPVAPAPAGPPPGPETPLPAESPLPPPLPAESPVPPQPGAPSVQPQSAVIGGNVGPVGSRQENDQLSQITGTEASAATTFLLGPLARGSTVHIAPDPGGDR